MRQEQDIYVRLIDSVTKQVSFLEFFCILCISSVATFATFIYFESKTEEKDLKVSLFTLDNRIWRVWKKPRHVSGSVNSWDHVQVGGWQIFTTFSLFMLFKLSSSCWFLLKLPLSLPHCQPFYALTHRNIDGIASFMF